MHIVQNVKCKNNGNQRQNVKKVVETLQRFMSRVLQCVAMSFVIHQPSDEMCRKCRKDIALKSHGKREYIVC